MEHGDRYAPRGASRGSHRPPGSIARFSGRGRLSRLGISTVLREGSPTSSRSFWSATSRRSSGTMSTRSRRFSATTRRSPCRPTRSGFGGRRRSACGSSGEVRAAAGLGSSRPRPTVYRHSASTVPVLGARRISPGPWSFWSSRTIGSWPGTPFSTPSRSSLGSASPRSWSLDGASVADR
jgi:hypothetical protein